MGLFTKKRTGPVYGGYAPSTGPSTYDIVGDVKWKKGKNGQFYPIFKNVHGVLNPVGGGVGPAMAAPAAYPAPYMGGCAPSACAPTACAPTCGPSACGPTACGPYYNC